MKTITIEKDALYKGKPLSELSERERREAENDLRKMHAPEPIEIVYAP